MLPHQPPFHTHDFARSVDPDHEPDEEQPSVGAESAERTEKKIHTERIKRVDLMEECSIICTGS